MDLGLPSGTLWLDRPLGATSVDGIGLMYAWGDIQGYLSCEEHAFNLANYEEKGLNNISSDLSRQQDAASVYYGGIAQMPSSQAFQELIEHTNVTLKGNIYSLQSKINGHVIKIRARGEFVDTNNELPNELFIWTRDYTSADSAKYFRIQTDLFRTVNSNRRERGMLILPVKSS